jgi:electron transport complex protein RnfD
MAEEQTQADASPVVKTHVAPGPHLQDHSQTTRRMMLDVLIGLAPVLAMAGLMYRWHAVRVVSLCILSCLAAEWIFMKMRSRQPKLNDLSAVVTGVILALSLPWSTPAYVAIIASFIAIGLGKVIFGGVGFNLFNPAMVGRAFVMLAFAGAVGAVAYVSNLEELPWLGSLGIDAESGATSMTAWKQTHMLPSLSHLFLGNTLGSMGETSALACLLGGAYLCLRRTASWEIPAGVILAAAVISALDTLFGSRQWAVLHDILGGALLFGAFFIATDPVTSPLTPKGKFFFGVGVGALVMLIRLLSAYPEGVMFAILLMNAVTPLINRWTVPKPFGGPLPRKQAVKA